MRRQSGAVASEQLADLGFGPNQITRLVRAGMLQRLHRGVYVDALSPLVPRGRLFAAQLALGPSAFLSHRTSLGVDGVRALDWRRIEVTVVSGHTPRHGGLFVHRTSTEPPAAEIRSIDGLRVSSPARALVEVAAFERDDELDRLIANLARRRLLDIEAIDAVIARRAGVRGIVRLRAALARYRPKPAEDKSGFEAAFAAWLATVPDIPPPQRNIHLGPWEIDFFWPGQRVAVETDGDPYHCTPAELERDRIKDAWLQRHKSSVLRVTEFRFEHDKAGIVQDLHGLLDGGGSPPLLEGGASPPLLEGGGSPPLLEQA